MWQYSASKTFDSAAKKTVKSDLTTKVKIKDLKSKKTYYVPRSTDKEGFLKPTKMSGTATGIVRRVDDFGEPLPRDK